ncbi:MAG: thiol:disulfide interchange protein DsbA/DsbL [Dehalococcoidia bacterium]|nr:thiol:disulfide interchange protein DsbA/DsbL [Dehalococcoidia bacterium]
MIKTVRSTILFAALLLSWSGSMAQPVEYEEGVHFSELQIPIRTRNPDKIEVAEYFSYGCPHCFEFEPLISAWHRNLPEDVEFIRTPAIWNEDYQVYAQTYYTIQALKVVDVVHTPIFNAIHNLRARLNSPQQMAGFLKDFGVAPEAFAKAYNSFGVRAGVQQADSRGKAYRSGGVPAIIINGKYRIEGGMAGSNSNMLRVADYLIEKERKARTSAGLSREGS